MKSNIKQKETEEVRRIIEKSNREYNDIKTNNQLHVKSILLVVGTMLLIVMLGKTIFNIGNKYSRSSNEPKRITTEININSDY